MIAPVQSEAERAEFEAVLRSSVFHRAPNLANFFRYTCERYFRGETENLKEYNIAVEALGRPADFNQKKDSIVRVEAHRLRKRLSDYYATEGAAHAVHITIPAGHYVPQFCSNGGGGAVAEWAGEKTTEPEKVAAPEPARFQTVLEAAGSQVVPPVVGLERTKVIWVSLAFFWVSMAAALFWGQKLSPLPDVWKGSMAPVQGDVRILAGYNGSAFHDRQGRVWLADRYYAGGSAVAEERGRAFEGVADPGFLRTHREGTFRYNIPVPPGSYEMRLYFVETQIGTGSQSGIQNGRLIKVGLNGKTILSMFDVLSEAGAPNRQHVRVFRDVTPGTDGLVRLTFEPMSDAPAVLMALELLPTKPGRVRPIRIVAQQKNVIDSEGAVWSAEQYAVGGSQVNREFNGGPLGMLLMGERYGNFAYHIPVAAGRYRLRLYFAETYFGTRLPYAENNEGAPRIFNVFANGVALVRDLNIEKEAGGSNRPLVREFNGLEPNAQGMIALEFIPVHNYAEVNAIEVLPAEQ